MKRNWNVIRIILEHVEDESLGSFIRTKEFMKDAETADPNILLGHVEILIEAGVLRNCRVSRGGDGKFESWDLRAPYISMQGHDLLDALRDEAIWKRIVRKATNAGTAISWEFIKAAIPIVMAEIVSTTS